MPDPNLIGPSDEEFYRILPPPPGGWKPRLPTPEVLQKSLDVAHDNIRKLVASNDQQRVVILHMESEVRQYKLWLKGSWAALLVTWALLGWVVKFLLPYAIHGMAK